MRRRRKILRDREAKERGRECERERENMRDREKEEG
jgi:hypothetical protein